MNIFERIRRTVSVLFGKELGSIESGLREYERLIASLPTMNLDQLSKIRPHIVGLQDRQLAILWNNAWRSQSNSESAKSADEKQSNAAMEYAEFMRQFHRKHITKAEIVAHSAKPETDEYPLTSEALAQEWLFIPVEDRKSHEAYLGWKAWLHFACES